MDWAIFISATTAVVAILAPTLGAVVNNRHQLKMKSIELYQERRIKAFENYLRCTGSRLQFGDNNDEKNYGSASGEIMLYLPENLRQSVFDLDSVIGVESNDKAKIRFNAVANELALFYAKDKTSTPTKRSPRGHKLNTK